MKIKLQPLQFVQYSELSCRTSKLLYFVVQLSVDVLNVKHFL